MATTNKFDRINRWLTLGANIGVVLGLIILIVEVRQNASLTRAAMEADKNAMLANIELSMAAPATAEAWAKSVRRPEKLTDAEIRILEAHLVAVMLQWDQLFQMQSIGLVSKERVEHHIHNTAPFYFGSAFAKNWWRSEKRGWEGTQMMSVAGPVVERLDERFLEKRLNRIRLDDAHPLAKGDVAPLETQIDPVTASPDLYRVLFENQHIRVVEYAIAPGEHDNPHTHPPKFMVVLASGRLKIDIGNGETIISEEETGAAKWTAARGLHTAENIGDTTVRVLLVEPKSAQAAEGVAP
ncbi:MAG: cupin domain-containing protein [Alphaproteobacteria bacterium]|nr:cupin domain-containing protein [Alphaproteobacteria bacterium]